MCRIPISTVGEYARDVCNLGSYVPTQILPIHCKQSNWGLSPNVSSQLSELFPRVFLTAGVLSPPRLMSLYAVHQVLTFIIIVKKKQQKNNKTKHIGPW